MRLVQKLVRNSALTYYNLADFFPSFLYNLCSFVTNRRYPPTVSGQKMTGTDAVRFAVRSQKNPGKGGGQISVFRLYLLIFRRHLVPNCSNHPGILTNSSRLSLMSAIGFKISRSMSIFKFRIPSICF